MAERRLVIKIIFEADQLPSRLVEVSAIFWIGEHSHYRVRADLLEEFAAFDLLQQFYLLL